ncbi:MAG: hypothetical protein JO353_11440 [Phycisphaerae bacterium]|nr:hypothetical protein [Phycisphaerae bacterium]
MRLQAFGGIGLLPIAEVDQYSLIGFGAIVALYIACIAWGIGRCAISDQSPAVCLLAVIAAYGLGIMLLFVGRSHPMNLFHVMVPLAIVLAIGGSLTTTSPDLRCSPLAPAAAICFACILFHKSSFLEYPSLLGAGSSRPPVGLAMSVHPPDLAGLPQEYSEKVQSFTRVSRALHQLRVKDDQVVVLDPRDTLIDYLAGRTPWSRYTSLFHGMLTFDQVRAMQALIIARKPTYAVMRSAPEKGGQFNDLWAAFHRTVARRYKLIKTVGGYDIWKSR